jgi:hypothetical protein
VYCHVSGGLVFGAAKRRYDIFHTELPLVLEAIRYGDRLLIQQNPEIDETEIIVYFISKDSRFNKVENWGKLVEYR